MNYGALPLDKNEVRVSNIGHAAGDRLGALLHRRCRQFFFFNGTVINDELVKPYLVSPILALFSNRWKGKDFFSLLQHFSLEMTRVARE